MARLIACENREQLFTRVAKQCATFLTRGIEKNGSASFVVPGGTTPAPVFEQLSKMSLLWNNVQVLPSDERWVDAEHAQSNEGLIRRSLLINKASRASFIPLKNKAENVKAGEAQANETVAKMIRPFDVTMIGMGTDGHFASLFPASQPLEQAMDPMNKKLCIGIDANGCAVAGDYPNRMTLSLSAILNSKLIVLLITGSEKRKVIEAAEAGNPLDTPVSALLQQTQTPFEVYWAE